MRQLDLDYRVHPPRRTDIGIASVGAGAIATACHLPMYRRAGLNLRGIFDVNRAATAAAAAQFEVPHVYRELNELLADGSVRVVDIAIPAAAQPGVAQQAIAAGKHLLCQKPLAEDFTTAAALVAAAEQAGVLLAVNQQMRWAPGIRATKALLNRGWLGRPFAASVAVNVHTPWENWPWLMAKPTHEVLYHSIHYVDALRFLLGEPARVFAHGTRYPGFPSTGETRTILILDYAQPEHLRAVIHTEHHNQNDPEDWYAAFRVEGTEGTAKGAIGALYDYPRGREDTLTYTSQHVQPRTWLMPRLEGRWFPDAFLGPMVSLLDALAARDEGDDRAQPATSGRDNLGTLRAVFAAYRSMAEGRFVRPAEIGSYP